jgi:hypothetical protein
MWIYHLWIKEFDLLLLIFYYFHFIYLIKIFIYLFILFSCYHFTGGTLKMYTSAYNINIQYKFAPHHFSVSPSSHSWKSFNRFNFSLFIHEYIIFLLYSPSYTASIYPRHHWCYPLRRTVLPLRSLFFEKRYFCLFKIAIQGISLLHFHVHMYYNLNWFMPSIFLFSTLVPVLLWFQQVKNLYIHSCIGNTSNLFTFLHLWIKVLDLFLFKIF